MYLYKKNDVSKKVEKNTFKEIGLQEADIEEFLRNHIEFLNEHDDEHDENQIVIGQQVQNEMMGRSDLVVLDEDGNLVLVEIKRDEKDIKARKEAFEFQAIRYAANLASIKTIKQLVDLIFAPYIKKHKTQFPLGGLTENELGTRRVTDFLRDNEAVDKFNKEQKIVLVASEFDSQTLSAVAWLNKNGVKISCWKITPYQINGEIVLSKQKVLPVTKPDDFFVKIRKKETIGDEDKETLSGKLPLIKEMIELEIVKEGDILVARNRAETAKLLKNGNVVFENKEISLNNWLCNLYGWQTIRSYEYAIHQKTNKTLMQIRKEYVEKNDLSK